jgi:large subunit ribosomal protein L30
MDKLIAIVRVRGKVKTSHDMEETLKRLRLNRVNNCVVVKSVPSYKGMIKKCQNHIAYGEIDSEVLEKLVTKHLPDVDAKAVASGKIDITTLKESMPFRLHPPRHGYKSVKLGYNQGGSLGDNGSDINKLIKRMI